MQNANILKLLNAYLNDKDISLSLTVEEVEQIIIKCQQQSILPLVYDLLLSTLQNGEGVTYIKNKYKMSVIRDIAFQAQKTDYFLKLYKYLSEHSIKPLVMKGIICRNIYKQSDYRISSDEDILVSPENYIQCLELMKEYGMMSDYEGDLSNTLEIKVIAPRGVLLIEMHKVLFPGEDITNIDWNTLFDDVYNETTTHNINNVDVESLSHTHHMLFLFLHLFKHFLHSGVGIRQVCDIMMYARVYGKYIDWEYLIEQCKKVNADYFIVAVLNICKNNLSLDFNDAYIPVSFNQYRIDEKDLLEDILSGGVFGALDKEELHGGTYMINKAKHGKLALLKTLFPSLKEMQGKVNYLKDKPYLLPVAWVIRIFDYLRGGNMNAYSQGKTRSELLKKYKINK